MAEHKKGAIAYYLIIAIILMAITYLEFALVEYQDAISWINGFWTILLLVGLSVIKFAMVVAIYMHLRDDDPIYTGFFSSGIVIAMGTFIALSFLFTVRSVNSYRVQEVPALSAELEAESHGSENLGTEEAHAAEAGHGGGEVVLEPEKTIAEAFRVPSPKSQSAVKISLPSAPVVNYSLRLPGIALAERLPVASTVDVPVEASKDTSTTDTATTDTATTDTATTDTDSEVAAQAASFDWEELGATTYNTVCLACHQANGQGIPGAFPTLAAHTPDLYNAEGGREYIINVVLYGLMGEIEVNGTKYNSVMSPWAATLSDEQIAATLNHTLTSWGNDALVTDFTPILPGEVASLRDKGLSSTDVLGLRP